MISVVKAKSRLPAGTVISTSDLGLDRALPQTYRKECSPTHSLWSKDPGSASGRNQMMTPLAATDARTSVPPGHVIAPLRLADTALAAPVRPGDLVDVIAADPQAGQATVVAAGARVITIPAVPDERVSPGPEGAPVLIDVDTHTASVVAHAAASATSAHHLA